MQIYEFKVTLFKAVFDDTWNLRYDVKTDIDSVHIFKPLHISELHDKSIMDIIFDDTKQQIKEAISKLKPAPQDSGTVQNVQTTGKGPH